MKSKFKTILKQTALLILGILIGSTVTYFTARETLWIMYGDSKFKHLRSEIDYLTILKDEPPSKVRDINLYNFFYFLDRIETLKEDRIPEIIVSDSNLTKILTRTKEMLKKNNIDLNSIELHDKNKEYCVDGIIRILDKY
jgi:hypothetical protein